MSLEQNLALVRERIAQACVAANRDPAEVRLLPVSKTWPAEQVRQIAALGVSMVGENRVQEAKAKASELADLDVEWSIIGHLQTNKAKDIIGFATELQSLDSWRLATELDRRLLQAGRSRDTGDPLRVYLQVNTSGETSKSGLAPGDVLGLARQLGECAALQPVGLMTIAAPSPDPEVVAANFATLRRLRDDLQRDPELIANGSAQDWQELSMGMSGDLEIAIAHGATVVRVGRAIFGERPAP